MKQDLADEIVILQPVPAMGGDHPRAPSHPSPDQNQNVNVKPTTSVACVAATTSQAVATKQHHEQQRLTHEQVRFTWCILSGLMEGRGHMNN